MEVLPKHGFKPCGLSLKDIASWLSVGILELEIRQRSKKFHQNKIFQMKAGGTLGFQM